MHRTLKALGVVSLAVGSLLALVLVAGAQDKADSRDSAPGVAVAEDSPSPAVKTPDATQPAGAGAPSAEAPVADKKPDAPPAVDVKPDAKPASPTVPPAEPAAETRPAAETEKAAEKPESAPAAQPMEPAKPQETPEPAPVARPPLSKDMTELRDNVRATLNAYRGKPLNTRDFTSGEVLLSCLAFGCQTTLLDAQSNANISAVGGLCWNYTCGGYQLLTTSEEGYLARVGYGLQSQPGQLMAVLAMARVSAMYELQVGQYRGNVANLVEFEKLECRKNTPMPMRLIGLSHYVDKDQTWKNRLGEEWSVAKLVESELARPIDAGTADFTDRLLALSYTLDRRAHRKQPVEGPFDQAAQYVAQCQQHTMSLQNSDGTWHPRFFALRGASRDSMGTLFATGRILEWLAVSLPDEQLSDPHVLLSVQYILKALGSQPPRWGATPYTARNMEAWMHALHALAVYDQRVFQPYDVAK
jgi:hypothetical protein